MLGACFEELYPKIYNYVYYRVLNREVAEDITSEVFYKAVSKAGSFDERRAAYSTWVFSIAHNCCAKYFRDKKNVLHIDDIEIADPETPESILLAHENIRQLHSILKTLNERERTVLALRYWGEFSYSEIAQHMALSPNHVGVLLNRAIEKIKKQWDKNSL